ncbi:hypothetical protein CDAR_411681 [Caerostris darwini]|uniref:Uncharacterized protein n=1 Tax=Caerostris darwini TaxID=1538125 RepID=A0AAV4MII5_9ARAC|nr:hypothetical protein CDAR_411681 [Caerostris darwini]
MSGSTEKKIKDPKSNEESDDSPLSQSNRTETKTKTEDKSETKATSGPHGKETKFDTSTKQKGAAGKRKDTKTRGGTEESEIKQKDDFMSSSVKKIGRLSEEKTTKEQHDRSHSNAEQTKQKSSTDKNKEGASDEKEKDKKAKTPHPSDKGK